MSNKTSCVTPTHYEVLGLSRDAAFHTSRDALKSAYRTALLRHHPDKDKGNKIIHSNEAPLYSIDQISAAYQTLSDHTLHSAYVKELKAAAVNGSGNGKTTGPGAHTGVEDVDLDDMVFDENGGIWSKSCRCGLKEGYTVKEEQLQKAAEAGNGEVHVGCEGCSLWIRVLFQVDE